MTGPISIKERNQVANQMRFMPERIKQRVLGDNYESFCAGISDSIKDKDPRIKLAACDLYARIAYIVGPASQIIVNLNAALGVKDEEELRQLVNAGRTFSNLKNDASLAPEVIRDDCIELLTSVLVGKPEWRADVIARLGGNLNLNGDTP